MPCYSVVFCYHAGEQKGFSNFVEHLSSKLKAALKGDDVNETTTALYRLTAVMVSKTGTDSLLYFCNK